MKFLCDVHISIKLSKRIQELGFQAEHVNNILDKWNTKDEDICKYADQKGYILISKDQDFRNSYLLKRSPKKLIKINLGNISNAELIEIIEKHMNALKSLDEETESFMAEISKTNFFIVTK